MKVVLIKNVPNLGKVGQIKVVADGYASNYLIPKGLAKPATDGAIKQAEITKQAEGQREHRLRNEAQELADKLSQQSFTFSARAGEGDRLYGSITNADIAEAIGQVLGEEFDKRRVLLEQPLRELGEHTVSLKLHGDVAAHVRVVIERAE